MTAYYELIDTSMTTDGVRISQYRPTLHAQGAWNEHEQHMGPASGIIAYELERYQPREQMRYARLSFDIFGLIHLEDFTVETRTIRPGRTIELVESVLHSRGRQQIVARAWRMLTQDSSEIYGLADTPVSDPETLPQWQGLQNYWSGGYINSLRARIAPDHQPGTGMAWITHDLHMVKGQPSTDFPHLIGMVDTANGIAPRQREKQAWAFPNIDLQIHMHRAPTGRWLGIEVTQQYGADGIGLTSSILHDVHGPFGRSEQILTLRPME